jgi:S-adenosylmethionine decarboxylase
MKDLAPHILRQRLLIEGFYSIDVTRTTVEDYLRGLARHLGLRTYAEPVVYSPAAGVGRAGNQGFDGFVPLVDSGISAYIWTADRFFSVVVYTCARFSEAAALEFTRTYFGATGETVHLAF